MHYRLMGRKALVVTRPTQGGGLSRISFVLLLGVLATGGLLEWRARTLAQAHVSPPVARSATPLLNVPSIPGTRVPLPPASFGLKPPKHEEAPGLHSFHHVGKGFSPATAKRLFDFYRSTMLANGWTVVSEGVPSEDGDWTLYLQLNDQVALIQLLTSPRVGLEVTYCPPADYC